MVKTEKVSLSIHIRAQDMVVCVVTLCMSFCDMVMSSL